VAGLAKLLTLPVTIVERVLGQVVKAATLPIDAVSQLVETLLSLVGDVSGNLGEIVGILGALPGNVILELLNILPISGEALTNILNALPNNPLAGAAGMNQSFDAAGYLKNATPGTTCKVAVEQVGARRRCAAPKNFVSCTTLEDCQAKCLVCQ
jgi:hypothetical protein